MTPLPIPPSRFARAFAMLVIALAVAVVYWPGLHGDWGRDDYFQLAFVRLLESPWALFVHDHFPVPGSVFRPLGIASMWLGAALFGTDYTAHATSDLALHVGVCLALFALLARLGLAPLPALLATLLFALHPAAIGTALWWSARFDLLAALFVLLALNAACAYRTGQRPIALACTLAAVLAGLLSKEIGLAAVAATGLLWGHWALRERAQRALALRALAWVCLCTLSWFGWRAVVLGTPASGLTRGTALADAFIQGVSDWLRMAPGYFLHWPRPGASAWAAVAIAIVLLVVAAALRMRAPKRPGGTAALLCCGLCLLLAPALLQAPVAALNAAPLQTGSSAVEVAMQSRLYYLGVAGLALLCGALLEWIWRTPSAPLRLFALVALLPLTSIWAFASHRMADAFALRSSEIAKVAHAAVDRVAALDLPSTHCHVVLLGVAQAPEWGGYVSMDSVLKALSPDPRRLAHCWFHAEDMTWFHLLAAPTTADDAAPFEPLELDGMRLPWRDVGGVVIAYLQAHQPVDAAQLARMRFLRWHAGRFEEAGPEVLDGRIPLRIGVTPAR
jgi:hypothetical protein